MLREAQKSLNEMRHQQMAEGQINHTARIMSSSKAGRNSSKGKISLNQSQVSLACGQGSRKRHVGSKPSDSHMLDDHVRSMDVLTAALAEQKFGEEYEEKENVIWNQTQQKIWR